MRLAPRITAANAHHVSLHSEKYNPGMAIAGFSVIVGIGSLPVIFGTDFAFRVTLASVGLTLISLVVAGIQLVRAAAELVVRVDTRADGLRFSASTGVHAAFFVTAIVGLLPGTLTLVFEVLDSAKRSGLHLIILSLIALFWLAQQLWSLRTPPGLTLTENGIRGVRGTKPVDLRWDELARAEVVASKGAKLVLHPRSGAAVVIDPRWTGSDPNLVAPIINHFLAHPEHRATLTDPRAAVRLVEEATATAG